MNKFFNQQNITNKWFYKNPNRVLKFLHIYVNGDMLVLLPIWGFILGTGLIDWKFMILEIGLFLFLRGFGEMIYWLFQQFGNMQYRPETNYKNLDNKAVYILYQLHGFRNTFLGGVIILFTLLYLY